MMNRAFPKGLWAGLLLGAWSLTLGACGGDSGTFLVVHVERGTAAGSITRIDLTTTINGVPKLRQLDRAGAEIQLPTTVGYDVAGLSGTVTVDAVAYGP